MKYVVVILLLAAVAFAALAGRRDSAKQAADSSLTATGNTSRIP